MLNPGFRKCGVPHKQRWKDIKMKNLNLSCTLLTLLFINAALGKEPATFPLTLESSPKISLIFDRTYQVMSLSKPGDNVAIYVFIPEDDRSSAMLAIGEGGHQKTIESIKEDYEGAIVKVVEGDVAGIKVAWWDYKDSNHLYSTCHVRLKDKSGREYFFTFDLVANSKRRLDALKESFSKIKL
jgi:hypothetical protein